MNEKLKPCPFCGGESIRINAFGFGEYSIECLSCYVESARCVGTYSVSYNGKIMQKGQRDAIKAWNRRATDEK